MPLDGVVRGLWREAVIEKDAQERQRVNRYRNPDEDLPADFEAQHIPYYQALNLPLDPDRFIADLQA